MNTRKLPLRKCTGCGEMKQKKEMVRVIRTQEGDVRLDATGKMNGRGAYICCNPECLDRAQKTKGFERSLKTSIPSGVYESLKKELMNIEG